MIRIDQSRPAQRQLHAETDDQVEAIIRTIFSSPEALVQIVGCLLEDLRDQRRSSGAEESSGTMETDSEERASGEDAVDSRPTTPVDDRIGTPLTLLDIIDQPQSPGCKRKRSVTHIGSIAVASITPSSTFIVTPNADSQLAGRVVVTRKRVALGRLFSGMGMGKDGGRSGCGADAGGIGDDSDEESESEDEDLIVVI